MAEMICSTNVEIMAIHLLQMLSISFLIIICSINWFLLRSLETEDYGHVQNISCEGQYVPKITNYERWCQGKQSEFHSIKQGQFNEQ